MAERRLAERMTLKAFVSYAHDDFGALNRLRKHLKALERCFDSLEVWHDERIDAGYAWDDTIRDRIAEARLFLMLLSPGFIASDYIYHKELDAIRARQRIAPETLAVPILLKPCSWQWICGALQGVPTRNGRLQPVIEWRPQDTGFDAVRAQVEATVERHFALPRRASPMAVP